MPSHTQTERPLAVTTPLGADQLLLVGLRGWEEISRPFSFDLDLLAEIETEVDFSKLLGQPVSVKLALSDDGSNVRHLHGICRALEERESDETFRRYRMEVVPKFWLLSLQRRSRVFQSMTVPDVLQKVFEGLDVTFMVQGTFEPRNYFVQYRESDLEFASRLMEEEGIYYWFRHAETSHKMVVANTPQGHDALEGGVDVAFETATSVGREWRRIYRWDKRQEIRSGKVTLWDHSFEMPNSALDATQPAASTVQAGTVSHKLLLGVNDALEQFDYPGRYAQRFDGVAPGGSDRASDVQKIFQDNKRTAAIRIEEESVPAVTAAGDGNCPQFGAGRKFELKDHGAGEGTWVLTAVGHRATCAAGYRSGGDSQDFLYSNSFRCIPVAVPFRPARVTPRPVVRGCQTAFVVGPAGEEIFTDKYGRVKVQFHWDRDGKEDAASSCWVRVATTWAGKNWGAIHIPRIGQEVVVDFLEGDPDRPLVVGSVYNADQMPPYALPDNKTQSGIKSRSTLKGAPENFNELRFEDKKGSEEIYFHAEKNFKRVVENDDVLSVGMEKKDKGDQTIDIKNHRTLTVHEGNETTTIKKGNRSITVSEGNEVHDVTKGTRTVTVKGDATHTVKEGNHVVTVSGGNRTVTVSKGNEKLDVAKGNREVVVGMGNDTHTVKMGNRKAEISMGNEELTIKLGNQTTKVNLGKSESEALQSIELKCGQSSVKIDQMGVTIKGMMIKIEGQIMTDVKGLMTTIKGDAMLQAKGAITMIG